MPSPTGASLFVGTLDAASSRSGFPAWSKTQRHAYCSVAFCAHQTLLPPTWKLCCLPASQLPIIGSTRHSKPRPDLRAAWKRWREVRVRLFREHPQSPRPGYDGLDYFDYDPAWRFPAEVVPAEPESRKIAGSGPEPVVATRFALARFLGHELELF